MTADRWWDYGPLEYTTRPAGFHPDFDKHVTPAEALHRAQVLHRAAVTTGTEVMPRPKALTGSVFTDVISRTLTVRQAEPAGGYERLLWQQGWQALKRAYEAGWPEGGAPWVWADAPKSYRVIHGVPADGGALSFTWPVGKAGFAELVSRPGLYALATVDISTHYFSTVKFLHRPG